MEKELFPEYVRCIITGPLGVCKTYLLLKNIFDIINFNKICLISPTGGQFFFKT